MFIPIFMLGFMGGGPPEVMLGFIPMFMLGGMPPVLYIPPPVLRGLVFIPPVLMVGFMPTMPIPGGIPPPLPIGATPIPGGPIIMLR